MALVYVCSHGNKPFNYNITGVIKNIFLAISINKKVHDDDNSFIKLFCSVCSQNLQNIVPIVMFNCFCVFIIRVRFVPQAFP